LPAVFKPDKQRKKEGTGIHSDTHIIFYKFKRGNQLTRVFSLILRAKSITDFEGETLGNSSVLKVAHSFPDKR